MHDRSENAAVPRDNLGDDPPAPAPDPTLAARFERSREIGYAQWHDGEGFDMDALRAMTPAQQHAVLPSLAPPTGWRDVEALAAMASAPARHALRRAALEGPREVRLAVARYAPELVPETSRVTTLIDALETAPLMNGLSEALDQIEAFHPPLVMDALAHALFTREGDVAYHCAELLAVIHGVIPSRYDWSMRPLFLRFNTASADERAAAWQKLQTLIARAHED